jgi:gliding motility-associated-like protein
LVSNTATGTYTFTPSAGQCATATTLNVVVNTLPIVLAGNDQTVCLGESVILSSNNTGVLSWDNGVTNNVAFTPTLGSVVYTLTVLDLNLCVGIDQVVVNVIDKVTPRFIVDDTICLGDLAPVLSETSNDSVMITGTWYPQINVSIAGFATYTFIPNAGQCANTVLQNITVNSLPTLHVVSPQPVCEPLKIDLTSSDVTSGVISNYNYFLDSLGEEKVHSPASVSIGGTYYIEQTSELGCSSIMPVEVIIYSKPIASFIPSSTELSSYSPKLMLENTSILNVKNVWDFGDEETSEMLSPEHEYVIEDEYEFRISLIVTSQMSCVDTAVAVVNIKEELMYYVPNSFTPDGDGINDEFTPVFTSGFDINNYSCVIFNRWGEVVFESNDSSKGWNGKFGNDLLVQDGTYTWKISFITKEHQKTKVITGHVNLMR